MIVVTFKDGISEVMINPLHIKSVKLYYSDDYWYISIFVSEDTRYINKFTSETKARQFLEYIKTAMESIGKE